MESRRPDYPWRQMVEAAQRRPAMVVGQDGGSLEQICCRGPALLAVESGLFTCLGRASVHVSPTQVLWRADRGQLVAPAEALSGCDTCDVLVDQLHHIKAGIQPQSEWSAGLGRSACPLLDPLTAVLVTHSAIFALRTSQGLWWQPYVEAWPVAPPSLAPDAPEDVSMVLGGTFPNRWYDFEPFTPAKVEAALNVRRRDLLDYRWHDVDDVLREVPVRTADLEAWFSDLLG